MRLGLIGAGRWGRAYIRTLQGLPDLRLARVASRNPETRSLAGPPCHVTEDWEAVAAAKDLDGVIIATPPHLHAEMARSAITAGLPVLVEKPLTLAVDEAVSLLEAVRRRKGLAIVDHVFLFHPAYEALKKAASSLGPIRAIRSAGGNLGPFRRETPPLWDYGSHDIALCLDLIQQEPLAASARLEKTRATPDGRGEIWRVRLTFPGGAWAEIRSGNLMARKTRELTACFSGEALVFDDLDPAPLRRYRLKPDGKLLGPGKPIAPAASGLPLTRAVESFARLIRSGSRDLSSLELGVQVVRTLTRCG